MRAAAAGRGQWHDARRVGVRAAAGLRHEACVVILSRRIKRACPWHVSASRVLHNGPTSLTYEVTGGRLARGIARFHVPRVLQAQARQSTSADALQHLACSAAHRAACAFNLTRTVAGAAEVLAGTWRVRRRFVAWIH